MHFTTVLASTLGLLALPAIAHPGPHPVESRGELSRKSQISKRCASSAGALNAKRRLARRSQMEKRNTTVEITFEDPKKPTIQNDTCVLTTEVTTGPYIFPESQVLRQDMVEDQQGVPLYLDIGVLNTETCEPLEGVLVDIWHCNATGSYSSFTGLSPNTPYVELLGQLNATTADDIHTDNTTWLRAMYPTSSEGVAEFKSIFPGFYIERAIHIHVQVHTNWVVSINGTIATDETVSTGQLFFAEDVINQIMALEPYASHTQINRTLNAVDDIYTYIEQEGVFNPLVQVEPLDGEDLTKGMVGYITIGVDPTSIMDTSNCTAVTCD